MNVLVIDNYDSFTWNLVHLIGPLVGAVEVGATTGPRSGHPRRPAGRARALARSLHSGRCRHMPRPDRQGRRGDPDLRGLPRLAGDGPGLRRRCRARACADAWKGVRDRHAGETVFRGINGPFRATRYHSLVVARDTCPPDLAVTAESRRAHHGPVPQNPADPRRPVPPGKHPLRAGRTILRNFLDLRRRGTAGSVTGRPRRSGIDGAWMPSSPTSPRRRPARR